MGHNEVTFVELPTKGIDLLSNSELVRLAKMVMAKVVVKFRGAHALGDPQRVKGEA